MTYDFEQSAVIPASPQDVYDAWLSSDGHTAMTGGVATASSTIGDEYTAWDGYIVGRNLELDPPHRILQSWRASEFSEEDADSTIEVTLEPVAGGTLLRLRHSNVPSGQRGYEDSGWQSHYFEPMIEYFAARSS